MAQQPDSCSIELSGRIFDLDTKESVPFATVMIKDAQKGVVADEYGHFVLENLCEAECTLVCSCAGYEDFSEQLSLRNGMKVNLEITKKMTRLNQVVVSTDYVQQRKKEESLSLEIVTGDFLKENQGGSLMKSLDRLAGVSTIDIGSGQSKPVIRGLGFNRVVVVENGIKHEGQQWGVDHGLEIDQYVVENVEVIKGPSSLRYGSDAMGGVIIIKHDHLPEPNTITGTIDLTGKTNNNLFGSSFSLAGRKDYVFASIRTTILDYGDYKVPTDHVDIYNYAHSLHENHLRNTAGRERNFHLSFGYTKPTFQSRFYVSNVSSEGGFFANAIGLEPRRVEGYHDESDRDIHYPFQRVNHFKIVNRTRRIWSKYEFKSELGFQRNFRQELSKYVSHGWMPPNYQGEAGFAPDLDRQFDKYVYSANVEGSYAMTNKTSITIGINGSHQDNSINGRGFIIPAFQQTNIGGFLLAKHGFNESSSLQTGLRFDHGNILTDYYQDWFESPVVKGSDTTYRHSPRAYDLRRDFSNLSWSVGYNYNLENWSFKINFGKSFRMPIPKELSANGVNYHYGSFERGDSALSPEVGYQLDIGLEYSVEKLAFGFTPFVNSFSNYIYLNPTPKHDRLYGNGNQIFDYSEAEVFRYGGEIYINYQINRSLSLGLDGEYVYARQLTGEKKNFTLPFSPPASVIFNTKYEKDRWIFLEDVYVSMDYKIASSQTRVVPPEQVTESYHVINLGLGGELKLRKQQINLSFQVQNLMNTKYFNHTSLYRLINVPEPGRNFVLNMNIPFSIFTH